MPTIHLTTFIAAPANIVFDLSRHVSVHKEAYTGYKTDAVAGTRFGLLEKKVKLLPGSPTIFLKKDCNV